MYIRKHLPFTLLGTPAPVLNLSSVRTTHKLWDYIRHCSTKTGHVKTGGKKHSWSFYNLPRFNLPTVTSDSCSWLTELEPNVASCCCNPSASWFTCYIWCYDMKVIWSFDLYLHGCMHFTAATWFAAWVIAWMGRCTDIFNKAAVW